MAAAMARSDRFGTAAALATPATLRFMDAVGPREGVARNPPSGELRQPGTLTSTPDTAGPAKTTDARTTDHA